MVVTGAAVDGGNIRELGGEAFGFWNPEDELGFGSYTVSPPKNCLATFGFHRIACGSAFSVNGFLFGLILYDGLFC